MISHSGTTTRMLIIVRVPFPLPHTTGVKLQSVIRTVKEDTLHATLSDFERQPSRFTDRCRSICLRCHCCLPVSRRRQDCEHQDLPSGRTQSIGDPAERDETPVIQPDAGAKLAPVKAAAAAAAAPGRAPSGIIATGTSIGSSDV
jgi:hypothetical protein